MSAIPTQDQLGWIVARNGRRYRITPNDVLWLARAARYEGGNKAATLWTWAWRFITKGYQGSLASLVRAHSQPVNPLWDEATDPACIEHPDRCSSIALARREEARNASWESLGATAATTLAWAQARVPNPAPRANNFADAQVSANFIRNHPGTVVVLDESNWYLAEPDALGLDPDFVMIEYEGRSIGAIDAGAPAWAPWAAVAAGALLVVVGIGVAAR